MSSKMVLTPREMRTVWHYVHGSPDTVGNKLGSFRKEYDGDAKNLDILAHAFFRREEVQKQVQKEYELMKMEVSPNWVRGKLKAFANGADKDADKIHATRLLGDAHGMFKTSAEVEIKIDKIVLSEEE
jgi:hypothetical protein